MGAQNKNEKNAPTLLTQSHIQIQNGKQKCGRGAQTKQEKYAPGKQNKNKTQEKVVGAQTKEKYAPGKQNKNKTQEKVVGARAKEKYAFVTQKKNKENPQNIEKIEKQYKTK